MNVYIPEIGVMIPEVYVPCAKADKEKWAVIACDQYTSQPAYWEKLEKLVGGGLSTYNIVFPEIFLGKDDDLRIARINENMRKYAQDGDLVSGGTYITYIERTVSNGKVRKGYLLAVDLEAYDYKPGNTALIRASEATVVERIPPRLKIREKAMFELPHIMLLADDPDNKMQKCIEKNKDTLSKLYDFDLMLGGGRLKGYKLSESAAAQFCAVLAQLKNKDGMLFAVGDGNHSLATAKKHWENIKAELGDKCPEYHPARFALAEIVNIHDESLEFEPIHRVVFNADFSDMIESMDCWCAANGMVCDLEVFEDGEDCEKCTAYNICHGISSDKRFDDALEEHACGCSHEHDEKSELQVIIILCAGKKYRLSLKNSIHSLAVGTLQLFLDGYLSSTPDARIDYIHGDNAVKELCENDRTVGFILPPMNKSELFASISADGALPRKTFSMGEADDKRFYYEARKII